MASIATLRDQTTLDKAVYFSMSRPVYVFDTSAVNRLLDDAECSHIVTGICAAGEVRVSFLNVVEAARTTHHDRRRRLLLLLRDLTRGKRPLEDPVLLVKRAMLAYSKRAPSIDLSVGEDNAAAWGILQDPSLIDEAARQQIYMQGLELEKWFHDYFLSQRAEFKATFTGAFRDRQRVANWLKAYRDHTTLAASLVRPLYKSTVGLDLPAEEVGALLDTVPELAALLLAWGFAFYRRVIATADYGRKNAGLFDVWFAVYQPRIDRLVTNDRRQYWALRSIALVVAPQCQVVSYDDLRRRLVVGP